eukprot:403365878
MKSEKKADLVESQPLVVDLAKIDQEIPEQNPETPQKEQEKPKKKGKPEEIQLEYSWKLFFYMVIGTAVYFLLCGPIAHYSQRIPAVDTKSEFFRSYYFRGTFNTTYIDFGTFFYYMILLVIGYSYTTVVTLAYKRKSMFIGRDGQFQDLKWLIIFGVTFYFISGLVVLRQSTDMSSYCNANKTHAYNIEVELMSELAEDIKMKPLHKIFKSIHQMDYLKQRIGSANHQPALQQSQVEQGECKIYSNEEVFNYNYYIFTVGYFVGLQFTHLDAGFMQQFQLTPAVMKSWPIYLWLVFVYLIVLVVQIFSYLISIYQQLDLLWFYGRWMVCLVALVVINNWRYGKQDKSIHIHHYNFAQVIMIFTCYENIVVTFINAVATGVMVEGIARWGADDVWEDPKDPFDYTEKALKEQASAKERALNAKTVLAVNTDGSMPIPSQSQESLLSNNNTQQFAYEFDDHINTATGSINQTSQMV